MFISYDIRNGVEYAKLCISKRNGKTVSKSYIYLGKVVDKEKFIFFNKDRGLFNYNPVDNSYTSLNSQSNIFSQDKGPENIVNVTEKKINNANLVNDIEFQRAKFNNELPKLEDADLNSRSIFENTNNTYENSEDLPIEDDLEIKNDIQNLEDQRLEFLSNTNNVQNTPQSSLPLVEEKKVFNDFKTTANLQNYSQTSSSYSDNHEKKQKYPVYHQDVEEKKSNAENLDIDYILKNVIPYGDVNFVQKIIKENQINDVIDLVNVANKNLFFVLIFHNILGNNSSDIKYWYDHSFIKYLYPNVDCSDSTIFEDLENQEKRFFDLYQQNVVKKLDTSTVNITNVLGDKRLLINHEGIPLFCLDAQTSLQDVLVSLKENDISVSQFIVNMEDICEYDENIKLIANVDPKHDLYDVILDSYSANNLEFVKHNGIFYQICKRQLQYEQYNLFTYTFCDILKHSQKTIQTLSNFAGDIQDFKMTFDNVIVSNGDFDCKKMLDIIKMNNPFGDFHFHSQSPVINFISSIVVSAMSKCLKINFYDAMMMLKNVKCFVDKKNNKHIIEDFDLASICNY